MQQFTTEINVKTNGINFYNITDLVLNWIKKINACKGLLNISILHTSASLLLQENADPNVLKDLKNFFLQIVPFEDNYFHSSEGKDDMPAHIKSALTNTNITLSILNKNLCIGSRQGIFLFEHRFSTKNRSLVLHYIGN